MIHKDDQLMSIGAIAQRSGVKASALRYYESLGLISSVRTESSHRQYLRSTLRRIAYIVFAQRVGFHLDEIARQLAGLSGDHAPSKDDWHTMSVVWMQRVDARIDELKLLRKSLEECIGCGCLSMQACSVFNEGDCMAKNGPGPRRWLGDKMHAAKDVGHAGGSCCGHAE
ncbi:MAG: redox-sensitive transcriptional activator SoxR [Burkholderiaceae bacterium]|jgi:MerR family redox-sensitive transcriptional activator SoxR|nr:redox-sensitive transcriptional activator SoxR [Burkholderiaceae bacterium]